MKTIANRQIKSVFRLEWRSRRDRAESRELLENNSQVFEKSQQNCVYVVVKLKAFLFSTNASLRKE